MTFRDIETLLLKIGFVRDENKWPIVYNYLNYRLNTYNYETSSEIRLACYDEESKIRPGMLRSKILLCIRKSAYLDTSDCKEAYNKLRNIFKHEYRKLVINDL